MRGFLLGTTCTLLLCSSASTFADDQDKKKKVTATRATPLAIIKTDEDADGEGKGTIALRLSAALDDQDGEEKGVTLSTKAVPLSTVKIVDDETITIVVNGEKYELKKNTQSSDAVKKIQAIIKTMDDDDDSVEAETKIMGHAIIIGPDGEKKEFKFGDAEVNKQMMEDFPKEVQIRIEKAMQGLSKGNILGQGIMIGPDGVEKIFELDGNKQFNATLKGLPEETRKKVEQALKGAGNITWQAAGGSGGRAIVIGPDGKKREIKFGDEKLTDIDVEVLEDLPGKLRYRIERSKKMETYDDKKPAKTDSLAEKLDVILKRLDKIEKEIQTLKK